MLVLYLLLHESTNNFCMLYQLVCAQLEEGNYKPTAASNKENKNDIFKINKRKDTTKKLAIKNYIDDKIDDHCSPKLDFNTPVNCFSTPNVIKRIKRCTSTPSTVTPNHQHPNDDISPITQSAQKMTKSMQVVKMSFFICMNLLCFSY